MDTGIVKINETLRVSRYQYDGGPDGIMLAHSIGDARISIHAHMAPAEFAAIARVVLTPEELRALAEPQS